MRIPLCVYIRFVTALFSFYSKYIMSAVFVFSFSMELCMLMVTELSLPVG